MKNIIDIYIYEYLKIAITYTYTIIGDDKLDSRILKLCVHVICASNVSKIIAKSYI